MTKEEQKRDKYYQRKYGITLAEYDDMLAEQESCCGICKRKQDCFTNRFAVDHDHSWKRNTINAFKGQILWEATTLYRGKRFLACSDKKNSVKKLIRKELKKSSVRGLLCPWCNRGLRYYADDSIRLANASEYLRRFNAG